MFRNSYTDYFPVFLRNCSMNFVPDINFVFFNDNPRNYSTDPPQISSGIPSKILTQILQENPKPSRSSFSNSFINFAGIPSKLLFWKSLRKQAGFLPILLFGISSRFQPGIFKGYLHKLLQRFLLSCPPYYILINFLKKF